jgi:uncharacterized membrane protein (UPF0127 family)
MIIDIGGNQFKVKTVLSSKDVQIGMMDKTFTDFDGMLFIMSGLEHCFWMKNCIIDLDIIFIHNSHITKIHHSCPPCKNSECRNYCGYGDIILELPGGSCEELGIREDDRINFISPF